MMRLQIREPDGSTKRLPKHRDFEEFGSTSTSQHNHKVYVPPYISDDNI